MISKRQIKNVLGELPLTAEAYWLLRQRGRPVNRAFSLQRTQKHLPEWRETAARAAKSAPDGKSILLFTTLRYWIEHAALLGMGLSGLGQRVTLAYFPYNNWRKPMNRFDQRRQDLYARSVLDQAAPVLQAVSFYDPDYDSLERMVGIRGCPKEGLVPPYGLPEALAEAVEAVSVRDVQYTLQVEDVDQGSDLYRLRLLRNSQAARAALRWIKQQETSPDVILTPNGSILEMGAVYAVARHLGIPAVTYEFGEQRDRIWLARNSEVMLQDTTELWSTFGQQALSEAEWERVRSLFASRQSASLWNNFSRQWQGQPTQGGEKTRQELKLDGRPIVLLAANVIGDSLTLGRQVFSQSMTEWLERTLLYFKERPDAQLVVRIHPGERYTKGPSVANIVREIYPSLPEHVHLVEAADPTNTYDIAAIADLGLVYTTTTGMEMAMLGLRVIATGQTHYRGKGFTLDPATWEEYFETLERALINREGRTIMGEAGEKAWRYAYRFFFDYPLPFPWHLLKFWEELPAHPLEQVLSREGQEAYGEAFRCLAGAERQYEGEV